MYTYEYMHKDCEEEVKYRIHYLSWKCMWHWGTQRERQAYSSPRPTPFPGTFTSLYVVRCIGNRKQLLFICTPDIEIYYEFRMEALDLILQNDYTCYVFVFLQSWVTVIALEFLSQVDGHKRTAKRRWQVNSRKIDFISTGIKWTMKLCAVLQQTGSYPAHTVHKQTGFSTEESLIYVCSYQSTVRPDGKDNGNRIRIIPCLGVLCTKYIKRNNNGEFTYVGARVSQPWLAYGHQENMIFEVHT